MRGSATLKHPPPFLVPCKAKFDKVWFVVNPSPFYFVWAGCLEIGFRGL